MSTTTHSSPRRTCVPYFIEFPFALLLGIWSALVWRAPSTDGVVTVGEGTSVANVFRPDRAAEHAAFCVRASHPQPPSYEERHLYVDVKTLPLEYVTCAHGSLGAAGVVTRMKSWSMKYTKTRSSGRDAIWENTIQYFVVNGE